ncbi:hypothetical protein LUZ60_001017 [Juncus effusus]|nr:hypothetical protein LUZ60_001017 [Juncus effusus]
MEEDDCNSSSCPSSPSATAYSCDEGSDLDRYCSANSVLATSSISSSFSHHHTDFSEELPRRTTIAAGSSQAEEERSKVERWNSNSRSDGEDSASGHRATNRSNGNGIRNSNSDDDDDDDSIGSTECDAALRAMNVSIHKQNGFQNHIKNPRRSSILMDSSTAFGSDDWDEFMLEREDGTGESAPVYLFQMDSVSAKEETSSSSCNNGDTNQNQIKLSDLKEKEPIFTKTGSISHKLVDERNQISENFEEIEKVEELNVNSVNELGTLQSLGSKYKGKEIENQEIELNVNSVNDSKNGFEMELKGIKASDDFALDEANNSFDEMVQEMEQILLDSDSNSNNLNPNPKFHHFRDGSSTASTSGTDDPYQQTLKNSKNPKNIDSIELVGAKQKKGDVSFGERLVGVKEYTVYIFKVKSGTDSWLVERRYRDFYALYKNLKAFFTANGSTLPLIWSNIERESKKVFGNSSPSVISERSLLLQECLRSVLQKYPFGTPTPLFTFLSPQKDKFMNTPSDFSPQSLISPSESFGKKISLIVEIKATKSVKQLLESQQYKCAGCYKPLDYSGTVFDELARTVGWSSSSVSRVCEYTGQLYCATCHVGDVAVLPSRVLHKWDFALYPVSQLAKAYLESIYDQPMLCVSAVNPFLFSKVPALLHIMTQRKKISLMLPYITCPFKNSVERGLGARRYLLECNDFFALRDLVDLSKGAFSGLPVMVATIHKRVLEHITQQCLVCYDAGVPCAARQSCDDPFSLIFPFQEAEAEKCASCGSIYHTNCFTKLNGCKCNKSTNGKADQSNRSTNGPSISSLDRLTTGPSISNLNTTSGFLSDIISKARPDKLFRAKSRSPVILMGSLLPGSD